MISKLTKCMAGLATGSLVAIGVIGCGGGGGVTDSGGAAPTAAETGQVTVSVAWPERTGRLVPAACNSVRVQIFQPNGTPFSPAREAVIDRPTTTATLTEVTAGNALLRVTAHPEAGAQGVAQAPLATRRSRSSPARQ